MSVDDKTKKVKYRGRKASRSSSEQRRKAILEAALRLVATEGVRGVRHRSVAKEADVPLSATTYYFKDISDLIADAFTLFVDEAINQVVDGLRIRLTEVLSAYEVQDLADMSKREELVTKIAEGVADHMIDEARNKRDHITMEQAFMAEAIREPKLKPLMKAYQSHLMGGLRFLCEIFGIKDADLVAQVLLATILRLEYEALVDSVEDLDEERIRKVIRLQFLAVMS